MCLNYVHLEDLEFIQGILSVFGAASGLRTNFAKCSITPIRCSDEDLELVHSCFPCSISDFPCTYLGIPLSVRKLPKAALQPLVDRVAHRLPPSKGRLTTLAGGSVLVQSVLSSIPVHVSMAIGLPAWVVKAIDKKRRVFLWTGTDAVHGGQCQLSPGVRDRLVWCWTSDQRYSARSAYQAFFFGQHSFACADLLWHAKGPAKCKFFLWFAFQRRCWTADLLLKRGLDSHSASPFCGQELETANHILLDCIFARQVWLRVLSPLGWTTLSPPRGSCLQDWWPSSRVGLPGHLRASFDSMVLLVSWQLWKERNSRVFDSALSSVSEVLESILSEGHL
uniref:Retrotransposon protein, putative, LINE subclass n=2 Tax=Oryza sativa subsp. japonica TaxID=39947 RepID=Q8S7Y0_ORYSJ|nr:Putative retroelement [Oryza sativa Japonica Group]AAP51826.1 retrotransposon protein, putative, LINE subclass [Oryza sativa Japonica Group]